MKTLPIDENRIIIKQAHVDKITGKWKDAVDKIIETYKQTFGKKLVSVYINGSVATGNAIENKSDIDTNAIVDMTDEEIQKIEEDILSHKMKELRASIPFVTKIETHVHAKDNWIERKRFQMKITGACVYGKNYDEETPNYTLSRETFQKFRVSISGDIKKCKEKLDQASTPESIQSVAVWIAKRLIRNAGTLTMWKGDFYTMEIPLMAEIFAKEYPEKKTEIGIFLDWTINPPSDKNTILIFLDTFGTWLIEEDDRVFNE